MSLRSSVTLQVATDVERCRAFLFFRCIPQFVPRHSKNSANFLPASKDDVRGGWSQNQKLNLNVRKKRGGRSAALRAEKFPSALSPRFCRGWCTPFIFLCLQAFPGPNHVRMARLVHGNLPLGFSVLLLRRFAHSCLYQKLHRRSEHTHLRACNNVTGLCVIS